MKYYYLFVLGLILSCNSSQNDHWFPESYFEELTKTPVKFEQGIISTEKIEYNSSLSFTHPEFYFSTAADDFSFRSIMVSYFQNGVFSEPEKVSFGGIYYDASDVQVGLDGNTLLFKMRGNVANDTSRRDGNVWISERTESGWGAARMMSQSINSDSLSEYYPIGTANGNIYFSRENPNTSYDIYVSEYMDGVYRSGRKLPSTINSPLLESDAYISPDESFMIFVRMYAADGLGVSDLYISFNENGNWSEAQNMTSYNSSGVDGSPFLSKDGQFLFFTSTRDSPDPTNFDGHLDIYVARFDIEDWK